MPSLKIIEKALWHRLTYKSRVYPPPEAKIIDNKYIYYKHSLLYANRPIDSKYKDLVNLSKRVARLLQHIFFGTPTSRVLGRFKTITYVMLIHIPDQVICTSCTIGTTNINGVTFWTGVCVGSPECIEKVIEIEKLQLVLLPDKKDMASCIDYGVMHRYMKTIKEYVEHHFCITKYAV